MKQPLLFLVMPFFIKYPTVIKRWLEKYGYSSFCFLLEKGSHSMCSVHAVDSCIPNAWNTHKGGTPTVSAFIHTATNCPLTQIHTLCNFMLVINNTRWPFPILAWLLCTGVQSLIKFHICECGQFSPVAISPWDFIRPLLAGTWTLFTKIHTCT